MSARERTAILGPQTRGTVGTLICGSHGRKDWGHRNTLAACAAPQFPVPGVCFAGTKPQIEADRSATESGPFFHEILTIDFLRHCLII